MWWEGRRGEGLAEGRKRKFLDLNLVSSDKGAASRFLLFSTSGIRQSMSVREDREFPQNKGVLAAAWEYSLKSPF